MKNSVTSGGSPEHASPPRGRWPRRPDSEGSSCSPSMVRLNQECTKSARWCGNPREPPDSIAARRKPFCHFRTSRVPARSDLIRANRLNSPDGSRLPSTVFNVTEREADGTARCQTKSARALTRRGRFDARPSGLLVLRAGVLQRRDVAARAASAPFRLAEKFARAARMRACSWRVPAGPLGRMRTSASGGS